MIEQREGKYELNFNKNMKYILTLHRWCCQFCWSQNVNLDLYENTPKKWKIKTKIWIFTKIIQINAKKGNIKKYVGTRCSGTLQAPTSCWQPFRQALTSLWWMSIVDSILNLSRTNKPIPGVGCWQQNLIWVICIKEWIDAGGTEGECNNFKVVLAPIKILQQVEWLFKLELW